MLIVHILILFQKPLQGVVMDVKQHTRKECRFASNPDVAEQLFSLLCEQQAVEYPQQFSFFPSGVGSNKIISVSFANCVMNNIVLFKFRTDRAIQ